MMAEEDNQGINNKLVYTFAVEADLPFDVQCGSE
jgi:hypothetical protein